MSHYDVVINGGGMAGAVLALGLSQLKHKNGQPLRICVIEHASPNLSDHPGFDARSIALSADSHQALVKLDLWELIADLVSPIHAIQVTDQGHLGQVNMYAHDYALAALGYVVELHPVGLRFYQQLQQIPNIDLLCPATLSSWQQYPDKVELQCANGQRLSCQLLVGADGSHSMIAQQLNLERRALDYQQNAIIANVQTQLAHQGRAYERFTSQGPLALLPMSQQRSALVWCVSPKQSKVLMDMNERDFLDALQREFGYRLGKITRTGLRTCYPLHLNEVVRPWHHRVVLIGNAAHLLHPIAGQGFNLGLRDVVALIETLKEALMTPQVNDGQRENTSDLGAYSLLSRYGQSRVDDQRELVAITSGLALLFSNSDPLLSMSRNAGLMTVAACRSLKSKLAWRAMGKR
ncbi:2-octaprenyl-6-methoxyphenyl hydroxylase [Oceanisphaera avium]|uniref:2-octaprenyl-6-methoxyphenyl hydroxylase n=1 Tax=Oceanisphaera avium TaxID=1903694 RepID=A0A1Y0CVJ8_9GAMM|nr:2-octaprenyl-6-methoxyphenyl hydroxylase [Oceanisphaera avium]ART78956.1 2-octaprenyl-6-methoxyphenyl hydroxylase [Oceanisphaera avium]